MQKVIKFICRVLFILGIIFSFCIIILVYYIYSAITYYSDLYVPVDLPNNAHSYVQEALSVHSTVKNSNYQYNSYFLTKKLIESTQKVEDLYNNIDHYLLEKVKNSDTTVWDTSGNMCYEYVPDSSSETYYGIIIIYNKKQPDIKIFYMDYRENKGKFLMPTYEILTSKGSYKSEDKYINGYINEKGCVEGVYDEINRYCMILSCDDKNIYSFKISHDMRLFPFLKWGL